MDKKCFDKTSIFEFRINHGSTRFLYNFVDRSISCKVYWQWFRSSMLTILLNELSYFYCPCYFLKLIYLKLAICLSVSNTLFQKRCSESLLDTYIILSTKHKKINKKWHASREEAVTCTVIIISLISKKRKGGRRNL